MTTKILLFFTIAIHTISCGPLPDCNVADNNAVMMLLNANECELHNIEPNGTLYCNGFASCEQSKIHARNDVNCLGGDSCLEAKSIVSEQNIVCSGNQACKKAKPIHSKYGNVECLSFEACDHSNVTAMHGWLSCLGEKSCFSSDVQAANIECTGFKACQETNHWLILDNAYCDGHSSCAYGTIETTDTMYCRAKSSCEQSTLRVDLSVEASGFKSLYLAAEVTAQVINAFGYESIVWANLKSAGIEEMTVNAFGYDASGGDGHSVDDTAKYTCNSGSGCALHCKGNGCKYVHFACETGAHCQITPRECMDYEYVYGSVVNFTNCPIYSPQSTHETIDFSKYVYVPSADNSDFGLESDDGLSSRVESYIKQIRDCDDYRECEGQHFTENSTSVYCLGDQSCMNATIDWIDDVQCYGYESCMDAVQIYTNAAQDRGIHETVGTGKGFVKCLSTKSCFGAGYITAQDTVFCDGMLSCAAVQQRITAVELHVHCSGVMACLGSEIKAKKKVTCLSVHSCKDAVVINAAAVECNGPETCMGAEINSKGKVSCDGYRSCINSTVTTARYFAYSTLDSVGAVITASVVYGYGYKSLAYSTIDSQLLGSMRVFSYGYMAGKGALVICNKDSVCVISCKYDGCYGMTFECHGAEPKKQCRVDPSGCKDQSTFDTVIDGTSCPMTTNGSTNMEEFYENREANQEYIGIMNPSHEDRVLHSPHSSAHHLLYEMGEDYYVNVHRMVDSASVTGESNAFYYAMVCIGVLTVLWCIFVFCYGSLAKSQYIDGYISLQTK